MKKVILSTVSVLAITVSSSFAAPISSMSTQEDANVSGFYVGLGASRAFFDGTCSCGDTYEDYTYGVLVRAGYDFNPHFGVEFRGATTWIEEEGAQVNSHFGLFAKPQIHLSNDLNVYALLGYARTDIGDNPEVSFDDSGFSWGLGLEFDFSDDEKEENVKYDREFDGMADQEKGWGLFVDYQKLLQKSDRADIHMISFGITLDF